MAELIRLPDGSAGSAELAGVKEGSVVVRIDEVRVRWLGAEVVQRTIVRAASRLARRGHQLEFELRLCK